MMLGRILALSLFAASLFAADWPEWRGWNRDGISAEKGLPEKWSLAGENLVFRAPYGGRSTPVVFGGKVFLQNGKGQGETLQERVVCLDANSGKLLWEFAWNVFQSDVPPHRIAWASPVVDPDSGNVYAHGANGTLSALSPAGKLLWQRTLVEDFGLFTTHGGRTVTPLVDGDLVIVSAIASTWGTMANRSHRIMAFDKRSGETVWVSTPGGRPYDTSYSNPVIAEVEGTRLLITGLGDGSVVGVKPATGEPVWRFEMAKRGINTAVAMAGKYAIVTHGDENLESNVMGLIASLDVSKKGALTEKDLKWGTKGFEGGYSSPLVVGDRAFAIDNASNLGAFDVETGRELWKKNLGIAQKASITFADGKIYVGTENGKFYILRPRAEGVDVLSEVQLPESQVGLFSAGTPEPVLASVAIANGRVYLVSSDALYCIGPKAAKPTPNPKPAVARKGEGAAAYVLVRPTEQVVKPGETLKFRALAYDAAGRLLAESKAQWALEGLDGTLTEGAYVPGKNNVGMAGLVAATIGGVKGAARVRLVRSLPWEEDFESYAPGKAPPQWVSATAGKYAVVELEGQKVLAKSPDETLFRRMRVFFGPNDLHDYTVEADIRAPERRRQMGDVGVTAQRYSLILFGNNQKLELMPWQPETKRTVVASFKWEKDTWYRLKLRVENLPNGTVKAQGKAWKRGDPEPGAWMVERIDPIGNRQGSPGLFGDAQFGVYYDNFKVVPNQ
jgi:outer membrane protein assembly factor BamB